MAGSSLATTGPIVTYGQRLPPGVAGPTNQALGPGATFGDLGLIDPRVGYNVTRAGWIGAGAPYRKVLAQVPSTAATANIAALANATSGTPMTLVSSTGAGITVLATAVRVWASGNTVPVGSLAVDGLPGLVNYGVANPGSGNFANNWYDPGKAIARAVSITGVSGGAGGAFLVAGADLYGYPQTATVTVAAGVNTVNSTKAFKFIYSVTPQFTDAHNYSVGTADIFGFPMQVQSFDECLLYWNSALITASTGFVAADTTSPATAATGDVRGTYAVQSSSDGTKKLAMVVQIAASRQASATGLFGVTPA